MKLEKMVNFMTILLSVRNIKDRMGTGFHSLQLPLQTQTKQYVAVITCEVSSLT